MTGPAPVVAPVNPCGSCLYWHPTLAQAGQQGECRLNPPTVVAPSMPRQWPVTMSTDWCGQYKQGTPQAAV